MPTNRIVAIASAVLSLLLAVLPVVADLDWESTAGIIAGVVAILGITQRWLIGWQADEERRAAPGVVLEVEAARRIAKGVPSPEPYQATDDEYVGAAELRGA